MDGYEKIPKPAYSMKDGQLYVSTVYYYQKTLPDGNIHLICPTPIKELYWGVKTPTNQSDCIVWQI